jgi:hypothetical protein
MTVAYECLISEGGLPSETIFEHPNYIVSSSFPVVVSTYDFSAVFLRYLYRAIRATIIGNNHFIDAC